MAKYKYIGKGHYIEGVPARDLTEEEYEAIPEKFKGLAEKLYKAEEPKSKSGKVNDERA